MKEENLFTPDCIRTSSGSYVNVFNPDPDTINIEDIAHALSFQCRWGGHLTDFYSVGHHSLLCAHLIKSPMLKLQALMHDASEAYLLDIPRPIKRKLTNYNEIENDLMIVIAKKFNFDWPMHEDVRIVDDLMLHKEWEQLVLKQKQFEFYLKSPAEVAREFKEMFLHYSMIK